MKQFLGVNIKPEGFYVADKDMTIHALSSNGDYALWIQPRRGKRRPAKIGSRARAGDTLIAVPARPFTAIFSIPLRFPD